MRYARCGDAADPRATASIGGITDNLAQTLRHFAQGSPTRWSGPHNGRWRLTFRRAGGVGGVDGEGVCLPDVLGEAVEPAGRGLGALASVRLAGGEAVDQGLGDVGVLGCG